MAWLRTPPSSSRAAVSSAGRAPAAVPPILPSASAELRAYLRVEVPQGADQRGNGPVGRLPHLAQGFRRQGADPVVLIPQRPHQTGNGGRRRGFADLAQCLARPWPAPGRCRPPSPRPRPGRPRSAAAPIVPRASAVWARTTLSGLSSPSTRESIADLVERPDPQRWPRPPPSRTDSSRSCKSGTSAGTAGAAAFFSAPSARAAATLTGALASCSSSTSAATVAPSSPPTWPRASAA